MGVMFAPSLMVACQLRLVRSLWEPRKVELLTAAVQERIDEATLIDVAALCEVLLFEMNRTVGIYELPFGNIES